MEDNGVVVVMMVFVVELLLDSVVIEFDSKPSRTLLTIRLTTANVPRIQ
jgi:hypothetical protein